MTEMVSFVHLSNSGAIFSKKMCPVILIFSSGDLMALHKLKMIQINSRNQKDQYWNGKEPNFGYKD